MPECLLDIMLCVCETCHAIKLIGLESFKCNLVQSWVIFEIINTCWLLVHFVYTEKLTCVVRVKIFVSRNVHKRLIGLTFTGPCIVIYFYSKTNWMHQCVKFILFWNDTLHISDGLSVHHQELKTVNTATGIGRCQTDPAVCLLTSRQQHLFDKLLLLYVQSWIPGDGRKDRPKHVEYHSKIK